MARKHRSWVPLEPEAKSNEVPECSAWVGECPPETWGRRYGKLCLKPVPLCATHTSASRAATEHFDHQNHEEKSPWPLLTVECRCLRCWNLIRSYTLPSHHLLPSFAPICCWWAKFLSSTTSQIQIVTGNHGSHINFASGTLLWMRLRKPLRPCDNSDFLITTWKWETFLVNANCTKTNMRSKYVWDHFVGTSLVNTNF